ncbi:MAG TPA: hypothetical protein VJO13_13800 [Ktedonobacterales bacterium]|nr:hypothetical protein [Ktedonobacterales bacterium]
MKALRGVGAIVTFLIGLFTITGGLFGLASAWAFAAQTHQPLDVGWLIDGLIATTIGFLFLFISRWLDPEHGPVRSYRRRAGKSRTQV